MYARSPLQRPAPTTPFPLGNCSYSTSLSQIKNISGLKGPRGTRGNGDISKARFIRIIPTSLNKLIFYKLDLIQNNTTVQFVEKSSTNWTSHFYKVKSTNWFSTNWFHTFSVSCLITNLYQQKLEEDL